MAKLPKTFRGMIIPRRVNDEPKLMCEVYSQELAPSLQKEKTSGYVKGLAAACKAALQCNSASYGDVSCCSSLPGFSAHLLTLLSNLISEAA